MTAEDLTPERAQQIRDRRAAKVDARQQRNQDMRDLRTIEDAGPLSEVDPSRLYRGQSSMVWPEDKAKPTDPDVFTASYQGPKRLPMPFEAEQKFGSAAEARKWIQIQEDETRRILEQMRQKELQTLPVDGGF